MNRTGWISIALVAWLTLGGCSGRQEAGDGPGGVPAPPEEPPATPARLAVAAIEMDPKQPAATRRNNLTVTIANQGGLPSEQYRVNVYYQEAGKPNEFATVFSDNFGSLAPGATKVIDLRRRLVINNPGSFVLHVSVTPGSGAPINAEYPFTGVPRGAPPAPPPDGWAKLVVETVPPGASVEVGLQPVNGVTAPGSGRFAGTTPCTVTLQPSDVNPAGGVSVFLSKVGYSGAFAGISDGAEKLEDHGTYNLSPTPIVLRQFP